MCCVRDVCKITYSRFVNAVSRGRMSVPKKNLIHPSPAQNLVSMASEKAEKVSINIPGSDTGGSKSNLSDVLIITDEVAVKGEMKKMGEKAENMMEKKMEAKMGEMGEKVGKVGEKVEKMGEKAENMVGMKMEAKMGEMGGKVEKVGEKVEKMGEKVEKKMDEKMNGKENMEKAEENKMEGKQSESNNNRNGGEPPKKSNTIEILGNCDGLFLRFISKDDQRILFKQSTNSTNYDVANGRGQILFRAIESNGPMIAPVVVTKKKKKKANPPLLLSLIDEVNGSEMVTVKASVGHGVMLVYLKGESDEDKFIGIVRRVKSTSWNKPPFYFLEKSNGVVQLKIRNAYKGCLKCCSPKTGRLFQIFLDDEVTNVGSVKEEKGNKKTKATIKVSFTVDTSTTNKFLIIVAVFLLVKSTN